MVDVALQSSEEAPVRIMQNKKGVTHEYRKDKNGQYRNKYGHLAPGEQLGFMHSEKNLATKEANRLKKKGGQAKLRDRILDKMPRILDTLITQAIDGDVASSKLLLDKVLPSLRSTEITDGRALPQLIVNIASGKVPRETIVEHESFAFKEGGTPSFDPADQPLSEKQTTDSNMNINVDSEDSSVVLPTMDTVATDVEVSPSDAPDSVVHKKEEVSDTPDDFLFRVR